MGLSLCSLCSLHIELFVLSLRSLKRFGALPPIQYNLKVHNLIELREWIIYDMSEPVLQAQNKSIDKDRIKAILNGLNFAQSSSFPKWLTNKVCVRSLQLNMDTCFVDLHSVNPWCHPRCVDVFLHLPASVFLLRLNKELATHIKLFSLSFNQCVLCIWPICVANFYHNMR